MTDRRVWRGWNAEDRHEDSRLSALLDDELDDAAALEVIRHVSSCPWCMVELEAVRETRQALRCLPTVEPPRDLYTGMVLPAPSGSWARTGRRVRIGAAAVVSAVLLTAVSLVAGEPDEDAVTPPVDSYVAEHVASTHAGPRSQPVDLSR